ncbi:hypothetical protein PV11_07913 [Exophiala sideris]|uniref:Clr5 domain-containing protein n=1 Tax=Exophiala sideris TaxID=1016849 RepID=A0A0D1Z0C4_9EURO|nr:hypothetical protein PV11_07913 [Exophiala sideris]
MAPARPTRRQAPSEVDWERIKPHLTQLYLEKNLRLKEVSATLAAEHNFHATTCMYKGRLNKWNLRKNFTKDELAAAANKAELFVTAGMRPPSMQIDDRTIPMDRVKRHFGYPLRRPSIPVAVNIRRTTQICELRGAKQTRKSFDRRGVAEISRIHFQHSPGMYEFEKTLFQVNKYYEWRLTVGEDYFLLQEHSVNIPNSEPAAVVDPGQLFILAENLVRGISLGNAHLVQTLTKRISKLAALSFSHQHPGLLRVMLDLICHTFSDPDESYVHYSILSYLTALARRIFVESHPVRLILSLTQHGSQSQPESPEFKILTLMSHIASRHAGPTSDEVYELEEDMIFILRVYAVYAPTYEFCQGLLTRYAETLGKEHWAYR